MVIVEAKRSASTGQVAGGEAEAYITLDRFVQAIRRLYCDM